MTHNRFLPLLACAALLLAFFALWAGNLGHAELSEEEAFVDILTSKSTGEILQQLNTDEPHPPLYYLIMHAWNVLGGTRNEFLVRFPSIALGLLLLSLTYRLGRTSGLGWGPALIAMAWLGLNPQMTYHVREARMYGLMAVTVVLAAVAALRFDQWPRRTGVSLVIATTLAALLSHYFNVLFVGAIAVWGLVVFRGQKRRWWLLAQVVAWSIFAGWALFMGQAFLNPASVSAGKTWSLLLPPWETLAGVVRAALVGYRDVPAEWLALIGAGLLAGLWLLGSFSSQGRVRLFLLIVGAAPLIVYAIASWVKPLYHPKYVVPWLVFLALASGWLIMRRPRLGAGLLAGSLAFMLLPTLRTIQLPYYFPSPASQTGRNEWLQPVHRQYAEYLDQSSGAGDTFGLGVPSLIDCYYASFYIQRPLECNLLLQRSAQSSTAAASTLKDVLSRSTVLWYRELHNSGWDPNNAVEQALSQNAISLGTENASGLPLRLYTSPATLLAQQQPSGARFGEAARLEGVWLAQRGDLHLALIWRSLADHPPLAAKVFVHLVSSAGEILAQIDGVPVSWTRPLETWQLGEQLFDVYSLPLPADDPRLSGATLQIGLYDPDTGARLAAYDAAGNPLPGDKLTLPLTLQLPAPDRS